MWWLACTPAPKAAKQKPPAKVMSVADAAKTAQIIMNLTPDTAARKVYREDIAPNLAPGQNLDVCPRLQHPRTCQIVSLKAST
jgi:ketol-acid reductoisomerase